MRFLKKLKAFTLIEIVVVLIIVGVLFAIAVPSYFSMINKAKTAEVLLTMKNAKDQIIACLQSHPIPPGGIVLTVPCDIYLSSIGVSYVGMGANVAGPLMTLYAYGNGANGLINTDTISFTLNWSNGNLTNCIATGQFAGLC